jgi:tetratricopeptide (TPR) repeat protein
MSRLKDIDIAIVATQEEDYLRAFNLFMEVYGTEDSPPIDTPKAANGLSYFGLCVALVQKEYKPAIELCKRAIDLEFYSGDHYANLARVYAVAGNRKKAVDTAEAGLKLAPENELLRTVRKELGVRSRPLVPFLDRANPINVTLGQARYAKKVTEVPPERKKIVPQRKKRK